MNDNIKQGPRRHWFIAPYPRKKDNRELCKSMVRVFSPVSFVPVFTTLGRATKFIEDHLLDYGEPAKSLKPIGCETIQDFIASLEILLDLGREEVAIDPESDSVRPVPIREIIPAIRARLEA